VAKRTTYEDMEKRLKELDREAFEHQYQKEALQKSEAILKAIVDSLPFDVFALDPNHRYFMQNAISRKNWGDFIGKCPEDLPVSKETLSLWLNNNRRAFSGETVADEVEYHSLEGGKNFYYNIIAPIRDEEKIFGILGILLDISELKKVEEALRKVEERYVLATKAARVGVWDWNVQNNKFYLDPNIKAILGYTDAEIPNDLEIWSNYIHPDDKQPVMEAFQDHIDGNTLEFAYEHRMLHKDGSIRWIMARGTAIRDAQGNAVRVVGTHTDITHRKLAEEAIWESEGKFKNLAEQSPNMIFINKRGKVVYANRKCEEIMGYKRDEFYADEFNFYKLIAPEYFKKHMRGEEVEPYEYTLIRKNGQRIEGIITTKLIDYEGDSAILGIVTDITERKNAEKALQEKDKKLERQAKNLEEVNMALKVLLEQRDKEKADFKESLLVNLNKLIFPYIEKLENRKLGEESQTYVNIIKTNLKNLFEPIANTLSSKYIGLTPSEVQVANLINQGKTSKEIALILNVSPKAVSFHRGNIRKKLGLSNKKINLRTYLQTFPEKDF